MLTLVTTTSDVAVSGEKAEFVPDWAAELLALLALAIGEDMMANGDCKRAAE